MKNDVINSKVENLTINFDNFPVTCPFSGSLTRRAVQMQT